MKECFRFVEQFAGRPDRQPIPKLTVGLEYTGRFWSSGRMVARWLECRFFGVNQVGVGSTRSLVRYANGRRPGLVGRTLSGRCAAGNAAVLKLVDVEKFSVPRRPQ